MPRPTPDLLGRTFGRLTVISRAPGPGPTYWICRCSCGTEAHRVRHGNLMTGNTTACGCQRRVNHQKGEANPAWKGDNIGYGSMHTRLRDNRGRAGDSQCVDCGGSASDWSYVGGCPSERYQAVNGYEVAYCPHLDCYVPRCKRCHKNYDNRMREDVA